MSISKVSVFSASNRPQSEEPTRQPKERATGRRLEPSSPAGQFAGLAPRSMRGSPDQTALLATGEKVSMTRRPLSAPSFAKAIRNAPASGQVDTAALGEGLQRWLDSPRPTLMTVTPITGGESREVLVRPWPHKPGVYQVLNQNGACMPFTVTRSADGRWMIAPEMKAAADDGGDWPMDDGQGDAQPYGGHQGDHWNTEIPSTTPGYGNYGEPGQNLYATPLAATPTWWYGPQPASQAAGSRAAPYQPNNTTDSMAYTPDPRGHEYYETPNAYTDFATPQGMPPSLNPQASGSSAPESSSKGNKAPKSDAAKAHMKTAFQERGRQKALASYKKIEREVSPQTWARAETWMAQNPNIKTKAGGVYFDKTNNVWKAKIRKQRIAQVSVVGEVTAEMAKTAVLAKRLHEVDKLDRNSHIRNTDSLQERYDKLPTDAKTRATELVRQSTTLIAGVTSHTDKGTRIYKARGHNLEHLGQARATLGNEAEIEMAEITATAYRQMYEQGKSIDQISTATDAWASDMNGDAPFPSYDEADAQFEPEPWE